MNRAPKYLDDDVQLASIGAINLNSVDVRHGKLQALHNRSTHMISKQENYAVIATRRSTYTSPFSQQVVKRKERNQKRQRQQQRGRRHSSHSERRPTTAPDASEGNGPTFPPHYYGKLAVRDIVRRRRTDPIERLKRHTVSSTFDESLRTYAKLGLTKVFLETTSLLAAQPEVLQVGIQSQQQECISRDMHRKRLHVFNNRQQASSSIFEAPKTLQRWGRDATIGEASRALFLKYAQQHRLPRGTVSLPLPKLEPIRRKPSVGEFDTGDQEIPPGKDIDRVTEPSSIVDNFNSKEDSALCIQMAWRCTTSRKEVEKRRQMKTRRKQSERRDSSTRRQRRPSCELLRVLNHDRETRNVRTAERQALELAEQLTDEKHRINQQIQSDNLFRAENLYVESDNTPAAFEMPSVLDDNITSKVIQTREQLVSEQNSGDGAEVNKLFRGQSAWQLPSNHSPTTDRVNELGQKEICNTLNQSEMKCHKPEPPGMLHAPDNSEERKRSQVTIGNETTTLNKNEEDLVAKPVSAKNINPSNINGDGNQQDSSSFQSTSSQSASAKSIGEHGSVLDNNDVDDSSMFGDDALQSNSVAASSVSSSHAGYLSGEEHSTTLGKEPNKRSNSTARSSPSSLFDLSNADLDGPVSREPSADECTQSIGSANHSNESMLDGRDEVGMFSSQCSQLGLSTTSPRSSQQRSDSKSSLESTLVGDGKITIEKDSSCKFSLQDGSKSESFFNDITPHGSVHDDDKSVRYDDENKSVDDENKSVDDENKSVDDENKSVDDENKSVDDENKSVDANSKSVDDENKSVDDDNKSVDDENKSVDDENKSVDDENKPVDDDNKSAHDDNKSAHDDNKSAHDDNKSAHDDNKSAHDDNQSAHDDNKSAHDDNKSAHDDNKSAHDDNKSAHVDNKSVDDENKSAHDDNKSAHDDNKSAHVDNKSGQDDDDMPVALQKGESDRSDVTPSKEAPPGTNTKHNKTRSNKKPNLHLSISSSSSANDEPQKGETLWAILNTRSTKVGNIIVGTVNWEKMMDEETGEFFFRRLKGESNDTNDQSSESLTYECQWSLPEDDFGELQSDIIQQHPEAPAGATVALVTPKGHKLMEWDTDYSQQKALKKSSTLFQLPVPSIIGMSSNKGSKTARSLGDSHCDKSNLLWTAVRAKGKLTGRKFRGETEEQEFEEHILPESKEYFYVDTVSGESRWSKPVPSALDVSSSTVVGENESSLRESSIEENKLLNKDEALSESEAPTITASHKTFKWEVHVDPTSNMEYYLNNETGTTQWEQPSPRAWGVNAIPEYETGNSSKDGNWKEYSEPVQNKLFYFCSTSGVLSWERPAPSVWLGETKPAAAQEHDGVESDDYAPQWEIMKDETSGRAYYCDRISGETQWEKPSPLVWWCGHCESETIDQFLKSCQSTGKHGGPWSELLEPGKTTSRRHWYYNSVTKEDRWSRPDPIEWRMQCVTTGRKGKHCWECLDPRSHETFYFDSTRQVYLWRVPSSEQALILKSLPDHGPGGWKEVKPLASGQRSYWYNLESGTSSFNPPTQVIDQYYHEQYTNAVSRSRTTRYVTSQQPSDSGWDMFTDQQNQTYYVNRTTGERQWHAPMNRSATNAFGLNTNQSKMAVSTPTGKPLFTFNFESEEWQ